MRLETNGKEMLRDVFDYAGFFKHVNCDKEGFVAKKYVKKVQRRRKMRILQGVFILW